MSGSPAKKPKPSPVEPLVSPKAIVSILNSVLRLFELPEPNDPSVVAKAVKYTYDKDLATYRIDGDAARVKAGKEEYKVKLDFRQSEKDHIIEVQHIVTMLVGAKKITETGWATLPLATGVHLAYYMNNWRNLFRIPRAFNQTKRFIPLSCWYGNGPARPAYVNQFDQPPVATGHLSKAQQTALDFWSMQRKWTEDYLFGYVTKDKRTAFDLLLELAAEMAGLPFTTMTWLTIAASAEMLKLLTSWAEVGSHLGIADVNIAAITRAYDQNQPLPDDKKTKKYWLDKRVELAKRAGKGLGLFVSANPKLNTAPTSTTTTGTDPIIWPVEGDE